MVKINILFLPRYIIRHDDHSDNDQVDLQILAVIFNFKKTKKISQKYNILTNINGLAALNIHRQNCCFR